MDPDKWGNKNDDTHTIEWKPISLLYIEYPKGDPVGFVLAWCSMLPIFIFVGFIALILFKRDLHTICYAIGILLNEVCNWTVKHIIKEPRPNRGKTALNTEYGMPSSHSQYMFFFSTYLVLFLFIRVHHSSGWRENVWKCLLSFVGLCTAGVVAYSRYTQIYLDYHTPSQVLCGAAAGSVSGFLWFLLVQYLFTPYFPAISSWYISELLMLRDSTLIPNIMWFEYTVHRAESRSRHRKQQGNKQS